MNFSPQEWLILHRRWTTCHFCAFEGNELPHCFEFVIKSNAIKPLVTSLHPRMCNGHLGASKAATDLHLSKKVRLGWGQGRGQEVFADLIYYGRVSWSVASLSKVKLAFGENSRCRVSWSCCFHGCLVAIVNAFENLSRKLK